MELLFCNKEVSIHQNQLRLLATEVFKSLADINPDFMKSYFTIKEIAYCLQNGNFLKIPPAHSTRYEANSVLFRACLGCNQQLLSVKQSQSLIEFKSKIKVKEKNKKKLLMQNLQFIISWQIVTRVGFY